MAKHFFGLWFLLLAVDQVAPNSVVQWGMPPSTTLIDNEFAFNARNYRLEKPFLNETLGAMNSRLLYRTRRSSGDLTVDFKVDFGEVKHVYEFHRDTWDYLRYLTTSMSSPLDQIPNPGIHIRVPGNWTTVGHCYTQLNENKTESGTANTVNHKVQGRCPTEITSNACVANNYQCKQLYDEDFGDTVCACVRPKHGVTISY